MKLRIVRADPAGNITLFVLDPVPRERRSEIAGRLMEMDFGAEQVGFACPAAEGFDGCMAMAGGEFCANASRAYGMLRARELGLSGRVRLTLAVSGSDRPVAVEVDTERGVARSDMPLPRVAGRRTLLGVSGTLVDLDGIAHYVTRRPPDAAVMTAAEEIFTAPRRSGGFAGVEAYGVIFLHEGRLVPLVKVPGAGTLCWEGSCGGGSIAAAAAESDGEVDGVFARDYIQPAGVIHAAIERRGGVITAASIGGSVSVDEPIEIEL